MITNHFLTTIPQDPINHYDVIINSGSELTLPIRVTFELIKRLQLNVAPNVFSPRGVYDGRKNFFTARALSFGDSAEFDVSLSDAPSPGMQQEGQPPRRSPKYYKIRLTRVAEINPEVLARFLEGRQSNDERVLTAITALNVVVRMQPSLDYPFNVRSFFTAAETRDIGAGIVLWRGYFQSVRPALNKMLINVDISTGAMYKPLSLMALCLDFFGRPHNNGNPNVQQASVMAPRRGLPDRERVRVQRFVSGVRVSNTYKARNQDGGPAAGRARTVRRLTKEGASDLSFTGDDGQQITVANYFRQLLNRPLQFPEAICAELNTKAIIPLELLQVLPGQICKKQIPPEKTNDVLEFSTKKPQDRLQSIRNGLAVLAYGQSEYVRQFGMNVTMEPLKVNARVLVPPTLKYGAQSKQPTITPRDGAWNMIDKRVYLPCSRVEQWIVIIYDQQRRFDGRTVDGMVDGLMQACNVVGIQMPNRPAVVRYENGQGIIGDQLRNAGMECKQKTGNLPNLIVVILPEGGNDIYSAVKHFGDVTAGVVTQCMKSMKCSRAKMQYYANVTLKLNVKLGGVNTIPDPRSTSILSDPSNPTVVMGADVMHPAPGTVGRPSFSALVSSVDSDTAKYIATMGVQTGKEDIIENLQAMVKEVLQMYLQYRKMAEKKTGPAPKRIIFYRDGISEGRFKEVLERELRCIRDACKELGIAPKITFVVVGKRHHVRFFPKSERDGDRSGNCPAGTVVDRDVVNPVEFDYYLQSHGGLLGTSRPSHYNVLFDENGFTPDGLQALSFALCHVYARATRSVSIPAPVYYADIVCSRAKHHYDPQQGLELSLSETGTNTEEQAASLERYRAAFKQLNPNMKKLMYFC